MTTVVRHTAGRARGNYVYIGRPSKWGNPYKMASLHSLTDRAEAILKFRRYWYAPAQKSLRAAALTELADKQLGCFCAPLPCHGDVIAEWVNSGGTVLK